MSVPTVPPLNVAFNGNRPLDGDPDILWDILCWMLVLIADGGTEVRYHSGRGRQRVYLIVNRSWFEFVEPFWKPHQLQKRLPELLAKGSLDGAVARFFGERPIAVTLGEHEVTGTCRFLAIRGRLAVRFLLTKLTPSLQEAARSLFGEFQKRMPYERMIAEFIP
jgi:hypothetical protein